VAAAKVVEAKAVAVEKAAELNYWVRSGNFLAAFLFSKKNTSPTTGRGIYITCFQLLE
jgi:hypothetical protein